MSTNNNTNDCSKQKFLVNGDWAAPIPDLVNIIKNENEQYRKGTPIVSDDVYDMHVAELRFLDPDNDWFKSIEPVNVPLKRKVKLPIPMKSLNKVKDLNDLKKWLTSVNLKDDDYITIMPKFDGLSLLYDETLNKAYSRGGSENEGQDCTAHAAKANISKTIFPPSGYTFGEFVFNTSKWERYFKGKKSADTGEEYKSPRNTAAGLLNRDIPSDLLQYVDFYRYGFDDNTRRKFRTYCYMLNTLCKMYNQINLHLLTQVKNLNEELINTLFQEWSNKYYIDGLVIYIDDLYKWDKLGRQQTTGNPNYAIAYKSPDFTQSFKTKVKDITWAISKSGALKPVVNIESVNTGDCTMKNPTGYNARWINNHEIAKGAELLVTRSGGVIPKILLTTTPANVETQKNMWDKLSTCPYCGSPTAWDKTLTELCCTNQTCSGRQLAKIIHFYNVCESENMGEETIGKIFQNGYKTINDMLYITEKEILQIPTFGSSVASFILNNNTRILKGLDAPTLMHASDCFPGIGKIKAKKILDNLSVDEINKFYNMTPFNIKGHSITIESFNTHIKDFYNFVQDTGIPILQKSKPANTNQNGKYAGKVFCFSGIRNKDLEAKIVLEGGKVARDITNKVTHLIVKSLDSTSTKIKKAKRLNLPIISISDIL